MVLHCHKVVVVVLVALLYLSIIRKQSAAAFSLQPISSSASDHSFHVSSRRRMAVESTGSRRDTDSTMIPLQQRLNEAGVPIDQMSLSLDEDWTRLETQNLYDETKDTIESNDASSSTTIEIKTLVWEVSVDDTNTHYVVTASQMNDKVHLSSLRDLVSQHVIDNTVTTVSAISPQLRLAPKQVAESLTGFQSGCIPPICHRIPMKLFIDASIVASPETAAMSIGAGILGQSLVLPLPEFLKVAQDSEVGVIVGSFLQSSRSPSPSTSSGVSSTKQGHVTPFEIRQQRKNDRSTRCPEPKDRLKEYRKFTTMAEKAKLFKTTARKQGRVEDMKALVEEAIATGDFPSLFEVSPHDGMDKNALHVCAWRGDFESVKLLVTTCKEHYPHLDVLNIITKGAGNYGKTPIFFALTQCREEVVRYLVEEGANLLIVNNKGQTPCSIALSHLKEDASKYLFEVEARQLEAGNTFTNYRETNSDGKLYGDLDPRFQIDSANVGNGEIADQIQRYQESVRNAPAETIYNSFPTQFEPRSLRPTVRWWVRETRSLAAANKAGYCDGEITFTQPRSAPEKKEKKEPTLRLPSPRRKEPYMSPISIEDLPRLMIDDVLEESTTPHSENLVLVDDSASLSLLEDEVDACLNYFGNAELHTDKCHDDILLNSTWALDCEWKPGVAFGIQNPVSTLQLSTRRKTFLVDLQTICQDFHFAPDELLPLEVHLNRVLTKIFMSSNLPLLGYGILQDISKLAASFPHMQCFSDYTSVIDLQSVASIVYSRASRECLSSLQKMTAQLVKKRMDKSEQCSDWTQRPLSQAQIDYAMLDAAILPQLLKTMAKENSVVGGYNGQFFKIHSYLQTSIRYTKVEPAEENVMYEVPMGSVKTILGQQFARQCWSSTHDPPAPPCLVPSHNIFGGAGPSKKERIHLRKVNNGSKRPKPIELKTLVGNLDNLPIPGLTLGYTKESCVFRVVGHRLLNTLPEGTYIGFNRRAGVVETSNAWIVFCNFGARSSMGSTACRESFSEFYHGGRQLLFRVNHKANAGNSSEASLYQHLKSRNERRGGDDKKIVLFARDGTKSKYIYCGLCECIRTTPLDCGGLSVLFNLLNYEKMVQEDRISSDFQELVATRLKTVDSVLAS